MSKCISTKFYHLALQGKHHVNTLLLKSSDVAHEGDRLSMLCLKMAVTPKICSEVMCIFSYKYLHIKFNRMGKTQTLTCYILTTC